MEVPAAIPAGKQISFEGLVAVHDAGLLCAQGIFSEDLARLYCAEIVLAISHLHSCGFVHRDLKPENVLLDSEGHVKITVRLLFTATWMAFSSVSLADDPCLVCCRISVSPRRTSTMTLAPTASSGLWSTWHRRSLSATATAKALIGGCSVSSLVSCRAARILCLCMSHWCPRADSISCTTPSWLPG